METTEMKPYRLPRCRVLAVACVLVMAGLSFGMAASAVPQAGAGKASGASIRLRFRCPGRPRPGRIRCFHRPQAAARRQLQAVFPQRRRAADLQRLPAADLALVVAAAPAPPTPSGSA